MRKLWFEMIRSCSGDFSRARRQHGKASPNDEGKRMLFGQTAANVFSS